MSAWICALCTASSPTYSADCPACGKPNALRSSAPATDVAEPAWSARRAVPLATMASSLAPLDRIATSLPSLNAMFGSEQSGTVGIVRGAAYILVGPEGAGKSTLALLLASSGARGLFVSREETREQCARRAALHGRLGVALLGDARAPASVDEIDGELSAAHAEGRPYDVLAVDSLFHFEGAPEDLAGSFVDIAHRHHVATVVIGELVKDGSIRGPRALAYRFDATLRLDKLGQEEGAPPLSREDQARRFVTSSKNRFGADGSWSLRMTEAGLVEDAIASDVAGGLQRRSATSSQGAKIIRLRARKKAPPSRRPPK
jgi:predicted ATP-dependent serine protease